MTGNRNLEVRETEHFYLDLQKLNEPLIQWMSTGKDHWRRHVVNFTRAELDKRELRGRAITRDMEWGISIPLAGYEHKRIYVWFEAVIGYLSATKEWSQLTAKHDAWKKFWDPQDHGDAGLTISLGKIISPFIQ